MCRTRFPNSLRRATSPLFALIAFAGACNWSSNPTQTPDLTVTACSVKAFFRDVTASSGVHFTYRNGEEANQYTILELPGGGVATFDFDGDGRLDLFVTGGGYFVGSDKKQICGHPCKLYRNATTISKETKDFRFEDVTASVGLDSINFYTHGAAVADFDNDGWPDLLVTGWGKLALFHNEPTTAGRKFVDVSQRMGLPDGLWSTSAAWGDLDGDGYADIYVCQYVDWSFERNHPEDCSMDGGKTRDVCAPKRFRGLEHKLFHNRAGRGFAEVGKAAGLRVARSESDYKQLDWLDERVRKRMQRSVVEDRSPFGAGLGVLIVDVNGDGKPDVYVANDMTDNFLYVNRTKQPGKIQLEEIGLESGTALNADGMPDGSMGVDAADVDGTGRPSLWVTNYAGELHALYRNECRKGHEYFQHSSVRSGLAAGGQNRVGWGTGFADLDHDGWEDLLYVAGDVYLHNPDLPRKQTPVLFRNREGHFTDSSIQAGSFFQTPHLARGAVFADFDNDGRPDLVVSCINEPIVLLHNEIETEGRHWLGIELKGENGRDCTGARIVLETEKGKQHRFHKGGGSCLSSADRRHVFGLGEAERVLSLHVEWPNNGKVQTWSKLEVDRYWQLIEQDPRPVTRSILENIPWAPKSDLGKARTGGTDREDAR